MRHILRLRLKTEVQEIKTLGAKKGEKINFDVIFNNFSTALSCLSPTKKCFSLCFRIYKKQSDMNRL